MRLTFLGSGSAGNCLLLESGDSRIFVDAGLRGPILQERLSRWAPAAQFQGESGTPAPAVSAALLTHEHSDHVAAAGDLARQGVLLYATAGTARKSKLPARAAAVLERILPGTAFDHQGFRCHPVPLPHDAADPVGYVISDGTCRIGVLTDCGHAAPEVAAAFAGCDVLVLETNHDPAMLSSGPYPPHLKRRIASDLGHLSNAQSAQLLRLILRDAAPPWLVICAHLSKTNNRPELARAALETVLDRRRSRLLFASQDEVLGPIDLTGLKQNGMALDDRGQLQRGAQLRLTF